MGKRARQASEGGGELRAGEVADLQLTFGFPKEKRIKDPGLLQVIRKLPCMSCGIIPSDAHHITTKKAGGHDIPTNLMPLCRVHHVEWHAIGGKDMAKKYPIVKNWLEAAERWDILPKPARAAKSLRSGSKKPINS